MLANALLYVALLGTIATTFLAAGLAMTRMSAVRIAQTSIAAGYQRAAAALTETLAARIQAGGLPSPLPTFTPLPPACIEGSTACAYETSETIEFTQEAPPAPGATCDPSQTGCAQNEQANPYVNESRLTARIGVTVTTAGGVTIAKRTADIVLRAINVPPYVILAGARDGTLDELAASQAIGDDGGTASATPNPCAPGADTGVADDTAIRVAYHNAATNACSDGSSWRSSSYSIRSAFPAGWSP
jgi:hypothetical protein